MAIITIAKFKWKVVKAPESYDDYHDIKINIFIYEVNDGHFFVLIIFKDIHVYDDLRLSLMLLLVLLTWINDHLITDQQMEQFNELQ